MELAIVPTTSCLVCSHTATTAAVSPVRVNGKAVEGGANVERVRCSNCGTARWIER